MYVYVDALFDVGGMFLGVNADHESIKNAPPFMVEPTVIMAVTSEGDARVFDKSVTPYYLEEFCRYIDGVPSTENDTASSLRGDESCVGWYIDQVVVPSICATSFRNGTKGPQRLMRKLNDKWTKPVCHSLERAFFQGWYPEAREDAKTAITLDEALSLCGFKSLVEIAGKPEKGEKPEHVELMARISAMSMLLDRYSSVALR